LKSAGRRRFFGSKQNSQEHSSQEDGHRSTTKVLRSLFFHNSNQVSDNDGSIVPPEPHLSLTSQTSHTTNESGGRLERTESDSMERTVVPTSTTERTVALTSAIPGIPGLQDNTSPDSGIEDNIGCVMRGCSDAELLGMPFTIVLHKYSYTNSMNFVGYFSVTNDNIILLNMYVYN
jgi:hypothetical protein